MVQTQTVSDAFRQRRATDPLRQKLQENQTDIYKSDPNKPEPVQQEDVNEAPIVRTTEVGQTPEYATSKLGRLVDKSYEILFRTKSIIWFDPFQDEITIDLHKINIIFRDFMFAQRVHAVMIPNITDVFVDATPIAATLRIVDKGFSDNTVDVKNLKKEDALIARRIIMGLIVAREQHVDLTKLNAQEVLEKLEELGKARKVEDEL